MTSRYRVRAKPGITFPFADVYEVRDHMYRPSVWRGTYATKREALRRVAELTRHDRA